MHANAAQEFESDRFKVASILRVNILIVGKIIIINLDAEVLTMQYSVHFNLANFPHQSALWYNAIKPSIYQDYPTLSLEFCKEEQIGEPAAPRREPKPFADRHGAVCVVPRTRLHGARDIFLTHALARIYRSYHRAITRFGLEWQRDSFVLREFVFAILSIASGEAEFSSAMCTREYCFYIEDESCTGVHVNWQRPCFESGELGALEPIATFGSLYHRKGEVAGAAPAASLYWLNGVAIHISTTVDGSAIQEAIEWGQSQGKQEFQVIVISIFEICFAEVYIGSGKKPVIRFSESLKLSPLRPEECMSLHPLRRPQCGAEASRTTEGEKIVSCNSFGTTARLQRHYPGLAALVNFFKVAILRNTPPQRSSRLPPEILAQVMVYADNETQKSCMTVSQSLCIFGFDDFRVDGDWKVARRPEVLRRGEVPGQDRGLLALRLVHQRTGVSATVVQTMSSNAYGKVTWVPIIGHGERRVLMTDAALVFASADGYEPDEDASDDVSYLECDDDCNY